MGTETTDITGAAGVALYLLDEASRTLTELGTGTYPLSPSKKAQLLDLARRIENGKSEVRKINPAVGGIIQKMVHAQRALDDLRSKLQQL